MNTRSFHYLSKHNGIVIKTIVHYILSSYSSKLHTKETNNQLNFISCYSTEVSAHGSENNIISDCTSDKFLEIGLPEMHHMIAPYQSILYRRFIGDKCRRCESYQQDREI